MAPAGILNFANLLSLQSSWDYFGGIFILAMFVLKSKIDLVLFGLGFLPLKILHYWEMDAIYEGFIITFLQVFI